MPKKKAEDTPPMRFGLGNARPTPMPFEDAMDVLMDPANLPPKNFKPSTKGSKGNRKPRKKK